MEPSTPTEVIAVAMEFECQGTEFYEKASNKTRHPFGKEMFLSLAKDEQRHYQTLKAIADQAGIPTDIPLDEAEGSPLSRVSAIFKRAQETIDERLGPDPDDLKVIDIALDVEQKSYDHYIAGAKGADSEDLRKIFERIADEENQHYRILADTKLYLTDPAGWHLKEEKPLIDGG